MILKMYTDGASRGNPGKAGAGALLVADGKELPYTRLLGWATNNQAEYNALILAFEKAKEFIGKEMLEVEKIICYADSELLVKQMRREYKIKDPELGRLFVKVWNMIQELPPVEFVYLPREKNKKADSLANQAIDEAKK